MPSPQATPGADTATRPPRRQWGGFYLHGEAWLSESLPVAGAAKVGLPRVYVLLGAAAMPPDHHAEAAWGLGLGTAGRARGRFTPSLDLMYWFLPGDRDMGVEHASLTQLRPLLAWQLKKDSRLSLLAGPTLNLATARYRGLQRWDFGRSQWLWADETDNQSTVRCWPGVQVGIRF